MIEIDSSDVVADATSDLLALWNSEAGRFLRVPDADPGSRGGTSTPRSTFTLIDALWHLEGPGRATAPETRQSIIDVLTKRARVLVEQFDDARLSNTNKKNEFTDAHIGMEAQALYLLSDDSPAQAPVCALLGLPPDVRTTLRKHARTVAELTEKELASHHGARLARQPHDFLTYHACRLLHATGREVPPAVIPRVQSSVVEQIAYHSAGFSARFDLSALVFGLALIQQEGIRYEPLVARGLEIIVDKQASDGSWPELRAIYEDDKTLFISSYEVALTLANLLLHRLQTRPLVSCIHVIDCLRRTLDLVRVERRRAATGHTGWANDRNPSPEIVESWTTAVVGSFAARLAQVGTRANLSASADRYDLSAEPGATRWPDLDRLRQVHARRSAISTAKTDGTGAGLRLRISDPTEQGDIEQILVDDYIRPVLFDWIERPAEKGVSILLPGDPGTRKTTLVKELATAIGWPLLTLTPPVFLREGLERIEAEAAAIFQDLLQLERIVVFFDESEEFFRRRPDNVSAESRTTGAFITAGMLPRLQALHDRRSVIFVVATNAKLDKLDPAAVRPGRFDRTFKMEHPRATAQRRYVQARLGGSPDEALGVLARLVQSANVKDGGVPFSALDDFVDAYRQDGDVSQSHFDEFVRRSFGGQES